jgi:DNA polymerase-1
MPKLHKLPLPEVAYTREEAVPIIEYLMNRGGPIAIDTETTGLDLMRSRVVFWSMATEDRRWFLDWKLLDMFDPLFHRTDIVWYLANAKYDKHLLQNNGITLMGDLWDIVVMDALEDDTRPHGLKQQSKYRYGVDWGEFKNLFIDPDFLGAEVGLDVGSRAAFKRKRLHEKLLFVHDEAPHIIQDYASCDAFFTYMLAEDLKRSLDAEELATTMVPGMNTLLDYFKVIEVPLTKALWEMERNGFLVDFDYIRAIEGPIRDGIAAKKHKIIKAAGYRFNPNSNEELAHVLFERLGLNPVRFTAGGSGEPKPSVDEKALSILSDRTQNGSPANRLIAAVLDYRHLSKLHRTYIKNLLVTNGDNAGTNDYLDEYGPDHIVGKNFCIGDDGRVHCRINQAGARTARLSSANPNMQNIPIRNDEYKIRGGFVADPGTLLVDYDYPQIEFRIAAVLSGEEKMMDNIRRGWDIHSANASNMYADAEYDAIIEARRKKDENEPLSVFDKQMMKYRDGAKTAGLGTMYGEGKKKMAGQLGISVDEAKDLIDTFFNTFSHLADFIDETHAYAHEMEYTYTMLGRKRRLHSINNEYSRGLAAAEERQAFNTVIQGSGAEMMKLAILRVWDNKDFRSLGGKMKLTVHDELISQAPKDVAEDVGAVMKAMMADPYKWGPIQIDYPVPIDPDGSIAYRWSDAK